MNILAIDDQRLNLAFVENYINGIDPDVTVILCQEPTKAYEIADKGDIDIIVLDIIMTPVTGLDLLKKFRQNDKLADVPILMFSSITDYDTIRKCFDWGANDYLSKPINEKEFNARMKAVINSRKAFVKVREKNAAKLQQADAAQSAFDKIFGIFDLYDKIIAGYEDNTLTGEEAQRLKQEIRGMRAGLRGKGGDNR